MKGRARRLTYTVLIVFGLGVFAVAYSYFIEPQRLVANEQTIAIKGLDPAFDGLKIVAISDIHGGSNGADSEKLRHIVELTNAQNADIVVLLGDYVSQDHTRQPITQRPLKMPMKDIADNLGGFQARYGVFAVLGNHDGWFDDNIITNELERVGYKVLRNQIATIQVNDKPLRLLGLKDAVQLRSWFTFDSETRDIVKATGGSGDIIVLEHHPDMHYVLNYHKTLGDDYKLMLAGHTHGGQVWLPVLGRPIVPNSYGQKYSAGHVFDGKDLFITTGIGTSILPFRFMVPPEIAVLTLRSGENPPR